MDPSYIPHVFLVSQHTWHQRLGHPGSEVLRRLISNNFISCNKEKPLVLFHACQLGKHVRLPFVSSDTLVTSCFDFIHSDVWTLPIPSLSDVLSKFVLFRTYVRTQFKYEIRSFQCDHGDEFDNRNLHKLFADNGIQFRFSCPKTSQQNGKSERMRSLYGVKQAPRAWHGLDTAYLLLYVDDIVLTTSSQPLLQRIIASLHQEFSMTDLDNAYAVKQGCLHIHDPRELHFSALKQILRYVCDADWAGCPTTRRSTSNYCVFLGNNLLSYSAKRQPTLSYSSAEAAYHGVANAVAERCWLSNLLRELLTPLSSNTLFYYDNVSVVYLSSNPVQHQCTKHIEIDIHFVRELVAAGQVRVLYVLSRYKYADIFTKGLHSALVEEFRISLSVRCPPAPTAGEC
ncbi:ribonuclease H-like domain-containing protein [Tanacetum coccineum]